MNNVATANRNNITKSTMKNVVNKNDLSCFKQSTMDCSTTRVEYCPLGFSEQYSRSNKLVSGKYDINAVQRLLSQQHCTIL